MFEKESIPNMDSLYMRVHKTVIDDEGEPYPVAFKNKPTENDGMSVDWDKYATPEQTRNRAKVPTDNAIIAFSAGDARSIPNQTVEHKPVNPPDPPNQSHSEVLGNKKNPTEVRALFMEIYTIVIPLEA